MITAIKVENESVAKRLIQLITAAYGEYSLGEYSLGEEALDWVCPKVGWVYVDDVEGYAGWDEPDVEFSDDVDFECEVKDFFL